MNETYVKVISPEDESPFLLKNPSLTWMDIELTERCNLNCIHCYINQPINDKNIKKRELSTDDWKHILSEAASLGCMTIRFTGGEPLVHKDFKDIYLYTRKLGIKVMLFTNATLISPELVELLQTIPPLETIEVSFYGVKKNAYEAVTQVPGSYESALQGIERLEKANIPFIVKTPLLPPNEEDMPLFERYFKEGRKKKIETAINLLLDLRCRRDCLTKNQTIKSLRLSPQHILKKTVSRHADYVSEMKQFLKSFFVKPDSSLFDCGSDRSVCIDAYGNYQYCMMLRAPETIVNHKTCSLKKAVNDFFPTLSLKQSENEQYLKHCGACFLRSICEMCPAKSFMEHGTLDEPVDYYCDLAHTIARNLGLINENEYGWNISNMNERINTFIK